MKLISIVLAASLMLSATACNSAKGETELKPEMSIRTESINRIEVLKHKYPEYFKLNAFKGVEIYVWQMAEGSYECGMMSGTNRNKTEEEIWELARNPISIEDAKLILKEQGIDKKYWLIMPVVQPVSSYRYEIDDAYREKVKKLFE